MHSACPLPGCTQLSSRLCSRYPQSPGMMAQAVPSTPPAACCSSCLGPPPAAYSGSPSSGWPRQAMWMRTWWGRPVWISTCGAGGQAGRWAWLWGKGSMGWDGVLTSAAAKSMVLTSAAASTPAAAGLLCACDCGMCQVMSSAGASNRAVQTLQSTLAGPPPAAPCCPHLHNGAASGTVPVEHLVVAQCRLAGGGGSKQPSGQARVRHLANGSVHDALRGSRCSGTSVAATAAAVHVIATGLAISCGWICAVRCPKMSAQSGSKARHVEPKGVSREPSLTALTPYLQQVMHSARAHSYVLPQSPASSH
jgi:hypothetical protein